MVSTILKSRAMGLAAGAGLMMGSLVGCSVEPPSTTTESDEVNLRMINASPNSPPMSLVLGGTTTISRLPFRQISSYITAETGQYDIGFEATGRALDQLIPAGTVVGEVFADFSEGGTFTVVAIDEASRVKTLLLPENQVPQFDKAMVRFVNAVPDSNLLEWIDGDGEVVGPATPFGEASEYVAFNPGFLGLALREGVVQDGAATGDRFWNGSVLEQDDVDLELTGVYTMYTIGLLRGSPDLEFILVEETRAGDIL